jgi:hypothetical protein
MQTAKWIGLVALTATVSGVAQAAPTQKGVRVVAGATALTAVEKANVSGMCGCPPSEPTPVPVEPVERKPGYGFGAKTEHYGPPGQGFSDGVTWRNWTGHGWAALGGQEGKTPKGHPLPPPALRLWDKPIGSK